MDMHVRLEGRRELARQIHRQLRAAILEGRLRRGDRLLPSRELAQRLEVSRNSVTLAYEWLASEGLVRGERGAGSFVEGDAAGRSRARRTGASIRVRSVWKGVAVPATGERVPKYDFGVGMPDATLFPFDTWRRLLARQIRGTGLTARYGDPAGHPRLRAAIAHYVGVSRGVSAEPDDVVVTSGAQQAFDLIARLLVESQSRVAVEEPGYPPVRLLFEAAGANVAAVGIDDEGIDVASLPDDARVVYVTPSHQFPLGMPMSRARRIALLDWAESRNAVIIEDDYDSEFRFGGRPLDTLHSIASAGRVIYVGSFSKSLLPALRLGFLVAPRALQPALRAASHVAGWFAQWPAQAALASLIEEGLLARHVRKMRREYAARHGRILRALERDFSSWLDPVPSVTGMHIAATIRSGGVRLERDLARCAAGAGVGFDRLSVFCANSPPRAGLVLGYGAIATSKIDEGMNRLLGCFESLSSR